MTTTTKDRHEVCDHFRHSHWAPRRRRTRAALRDSGATDATLDRFDQCGNRAWVMVAKGQADRFRLCLNRCRNRWCSPCSTEKRRTLQVNIRTACGGKDLRFLTLTLKSSDTPLSQQLARLRKSFRKLRQLRSMRGVMTGGVYFVEITRNARTRQWHPHLHVLFEGHYQHKDVWADLWLQVTGDSFIIDIRRVPDSSLAAGYISKYAGKPTSAKITHDPQAFQEMIEALAGSKTFHVFGTWKDLHLSKPTEDDTEWVPLMPLDVCITKARDGDAGCQVILNYLRRSDSSEPLDKDSDTT